MQLQTVSVSLISLFTTILIHTSFCYEATYMSEDSAKGGNFAEQLSPLIFLKKKVFPVQVFFLRT